MEEESAQVVLYDTELLIQYLYKYQYYIIPGNISDIFNTYLVHKIYTEYCMKNTGIKYRDK